MPSVIDLDEERSRRAAAAFTLARGDDTELAALLIEERKRGGPVVFAEGDLYEYDEPDGIWCATDDAVLSRTVQGYAGTPAGEKGRPLKVSAGAVRGTIKLAHDLVATPQHFTPDPPAPSGVAFRNGFLRVEMGQPRLTNHSPNNLARHRVNADYNPDAQHPELDSFFDAVFADASEEERAARVMCLQEFVGACLVGQAPTYQRCIVLLGPGANGKSQTEAVCRAPFPPRTVTSLPPQQWGERFQLAKLVGALANIVDEIPEREIVSGEVFKSVITGEPIHLERKHKDPFEAPLRAGHMFSANALPSTADLSHGFFRRFIIIRFDRNMETAQESRRDAAKAVISTELPGIIAWAIEGAARLQGQGRYTEPVSSTQAVEDWQRSANPVALFLEERTRRVDPALLGRVGTKGSQLYSAYRDWSIKSGFRTVSSRTFAERMKDLKCFSTHQNDGDYYPVTVPAEAP